MRTLLTILIFLGSFTLSAQETKASAKDYDNLAGDMCDCVNKNITGLSDGAKAIYIKYASNPDLLSIKLKEYYSENLDAGENDFDILDEAGDNIQSCVDALEEKYTNVYTDNSQQEIEALVVEILRMKSGCELISALFKIAKSM